MEITEYAKTSKIPFKTLRWMEKIRIVSNPFTDKELNGLELIEKVWNKRDFLRPQLKLMDVKTRKILIGTCGLETKWERYAYTRFMNLEPGQRIFMKYLIPEIEITFRFKMSPFNIFKLYQVRKRAHKAKERKCKNPQNHLTENPNNDPDKSEIVVTK
jgi:hypothetical protein